MGKKKKKFFTKSNSQTFALVHRSQKELLAHEPEANQLVLAPLGGTKTNKKLVQVLPKDVLPSKEIKERPQPFYFEEDPDVEEALKNPEDYEELPDEFVKIAESKNSIQKTKKKDYSDEEEFESDEEEYDEEYDEDNFSGELNDILNFCGSL